MKKLSFLLCLVWLIFGNLCFATDLIGHWNFEETSSPLVDLSGNGYNCTESGSPTYSQTGAPNRGNAVSFDQSTPDYFDCGTPAKFDITGAITITAWINPDTDNEVGYILAKTSSGSTSSGYGFIVQLSNGRVGVTALTGGHAWGDGTITGAGGKWMHVAATYDGSSVITLYYNGVSSGGASGRTIPSNADNVYIGNRENGTTNVVLFSGLIDDLRVWNYALTAIQIQHIYMQGKGPSAFKDVYPEYAYKQFQSRIQEVNHAKKNSFARLLGRFFKLPSVSLGR